MNMTRCDPMCQHYEELLQKIYAYGQTERNERTGRVIHMLEGGQSFKLDLSCNLLPVPGNRRYWPHVAAAETAWQFMGTQDPAFMMEHAPKLWGKFTDEKGEIPTAYGWRWREAFGRDQLGLAVEALTRDPTNRQLYVSAWDPAVDGLGSPNQPKNVPCPVGFSLTTSDDRVHMSLFIRSSDVFLGLPYDVMCYALTLDAVAASVGRRPGTLHVTLAHAHIYDDHMGFVEECLKGSRTEWIHPNDGEPDLPGWDTSEIREAPRAYVRQMKRLAGRVDRNEWDPKPEVVI